MAIIICYSSKQSCLYKQPFKEGQRNLINDFLKTCNVFFLVEKFTDFLDDNFTFVHLALKLFSITRFCSLN